MADPTQLQAVRLYLRRKYREDVPGLTTLADTVFSSLEESVTITSTGHDGVTASGQIAFPRHILSLAIEQVLQELDGDYTPTPTRDLGTYVRFD